VKPFFSGPSRESRRIDLPYLLSNGTFEAVNVITVASSDKLGT